MKASFGPMARTLSCLSATKYTYHVKRDRSLTVMTDTIYFWHERSLTRDNQSQRNESYICFPTLNAETILFLHYPGSDRSSATPATSHTNSPSKSSIRCFSELTNCLIFLKGCHVIYSNYFDSEQSKASSQETSCFISSCPPFFLAVRCLLTMPAALVFYLDWATFSVPEVKSQMRYFKYFLDGIFYISGLQDIVSPGDGLFCAKLWKNLLDLNRWPVTASVNSPGRDKEVNCVKNWAREYHQEQRRRGWTQGWKQATACVWGLHTANELTTAQFWVLLRKEGWRPVVSGGPLGA